jgi:hypothetical protein
VCRGSTSEKSQKRCKSGSIDDDSHRLTRLQRRRRPRGRNHGSPVPVDASHARVRRPRMGNDQRNRRTSASPAPWRRRPRLALRGSWTCQAQAEPYGPPVSRSPSAARSAQELERLPVLHADQVADWPRWWRSRAGAEHRGIGRGWYAPDLRLACHQQVAAFKPSPLVNQSACGTHQDKFRIFAPSMPLAHSRLSR